MQIPHPSIAEIMGQSMFDWVAIDMEHGSISLSQLPDIFRALELGNTLPLVRISEGTEKECKQVLDAGAGGVIVPMIQNAKELYKIKNYISWPPNGKRGIAYSRANLFGKNFNEYSKEAQEPLFIAMIENSTAIENIDEILKFTSLDALFIGPYDLSASLGKVGDFKNKNFINSIKYIREKSKKYGVAHGVHIVQPNKNEIKKNISDGAQFLAYSIDSVILSNGFALSIN